MKSIYIAGPFFNDNERKNLNAMIEAVKRYFPDHYLFIPMEHNVPGGNDLDDDGNYLMPNHVWGKCVFEMDVEGLNECDMVIAYYGGLYSDTGTAWEVGYAYAKGIPVYLWIPDEVNMSSVMLSNGVHKVLSNKIVEQK